MFTWSGALLISIGIVANILIIWPIFEVMGVGYFDLVILLSGASLTMNDNFDLESPRNEIGKKEDSNL